MPEQGGQGGGEGGTGGANGGIVEEPEEGREGRGPRVVRRRRRDYQESSELVQSLLGRFGSSDRALEHLAQDNYELREDRREQDTVIAGLKTTLKTKTVPEGAVVLTGPKAEAWKKIDAFATELKLPEDKIGDTLVERAKKAATLESEKQKSELSAARKAVAKAAGVNGDVLDPLLDTYSLEVRTVEVEVQGTDGKTTKKQIAEVRKAGDANASWERLTDFVAKDTSPLKPFAAALAAKTTQQSGNAGNAGNAGNGGTTGIAFPDQQGGNQSGGANPVVEDFLKADRERANRSNPLRAPTDTQTKKTA